MIREKAEKGGSDAVLDGLYSRPSTICMNMCTLDGSILEILGIHSFEDQVVRCKRCFPVLQSRLLPCAFSTYIEVETVYLIACWLV